MDYLISDATAKKLKERHHIGGLLDGDLPEYQDKKPGKMRKKAAS